MSVKKYSCPLGAYIIEDDVISVSFCMYHLLLCKY